MGPQQDRPSGSGIVSGAVLIAEWFTARRWEGMFRACSGSSSPGGRNCLAQSMRLKFLKPTGEEIELIAVAKQVWRALCAMVMDVTIKRVAGRRTTCHNRQVQTGFTSKRTSDERLRPPLR
jgi:hypothetical protein